MSDFDISPDESRAAFQEHDIVLLWDRFCCAAIETFEMQGASGTSHDHFCDVIGRFSIGTNPRFLSSVENLRQPSKTFCHMGASIHTKPHDDGFPVILDDAFFE